MATKATSRPSAATARLPETITSRDNSWLKRFRAALAGDAPRAAADGKADVAGIEGARLVETALEIAARGGGVACQGASGLDRQGAIGLEIVALLSSDTGARHFARLAPLVPPSAHILHTSDRLFAQIAGTAAPQGIAALVRPRAATFDDLVCGVPLILVLAGVQDPGNVGVLVRTAEAFGATGAAACAAGGIGTANPFAPKALRASAGAALRLPILRGAAAPILMAQLRVAGVRVIAACPQDAPAATAGAKTPVDTPTRSGREAAATWPSGRKAALPWEVDWRGPAALLVGNEGAGLPAELVRSADEIVEIPQAHRDDGGDGVDSLNAAVAGGVLLYEAARQRGLR